MTAPEQSRHTIDVAIARVHDGAWSDVTDVVATEEPMEVRVVSGPTDARRTDSIAITMRTPGNDFELAVGFLHAEGAFATRDAVLDVSYCPDPDEPQTFNIVNVTLNPSAAFDPEAHLRNSYATSSCGVCGKASLEALRCLATPHASEASLRMSETTITRLPSLLREAQPLFETTGGLHAVGLFDASGVLITLREDVGRHNAMDKIVGGELMRGGLPLAGRIAVLSGRASWELMQKAAVAGIPIVVAVGAPSSLAVDLAREFGITLVGFTRPDGFNIYAGAERITS